MPLRPGKYYPPTEHTLIDAATQLTPGTLFTIYFTVIVLGYCGLDWVMARMFRWCNSNKMMSYAEVRDMVVT